MKRPIILMIVVVVIIPIFCMLCCTRIDAGHEGIRVKQYGSDKGVQDISLVTGRVWYNPLTESVYEFPIFVQTADYNPFTVNAKDGSVFTVDPTITFRVIPGKSPEIFKKYRKGIEEITRSTLYNYVRDAFRIQFNKYTTDSMISSRETFENSVQVQLTASLLKEGFDLEQMTSGIQYPETITQAIDAKNRAVQQAMQVENELRVTEANAKKLIIQAEAEARANQLRQQSLTPLLIQQQFIEKWDGKTPLYGNSPTFFKNVQ
ncbi:prohibitin family protein [Chitinophaga filiformis]|uniref:Regulator of protease activity HflC, stomatin/prohibitin superfamily n=1 Tax=Chitinophaga filiformis TaxID=104663 RepID=A0A1G8C8U8_CHIFI|nr:prohibitin family protein [Chitinophaga filiformis]SDH41844.1 Regulator of protease activity HflC, stomatin/prohibitin superfamily [Chitinophaga filiformis]